MTLGRSMKRLVTRAADDATVIEASHREPDHFAILFERHAPHIHRYLTRRVGEQAADDLVADTFLVAFDKRRAYDARYRDARPWLYGIATILVGQHRRQEVRQFRLRQAAGPDPALPDYSERTVANVTAQSLRPVLDEALTGLSDQDRDVLLLIAWEQLSYPEVARALGIPPGTVGSRLHRARAQVRAALANTPAAATYKEIVTNE
jgi:RNA polymerase sigma-70 factor (ECF subfamily)